jgi:hypothetical protein
MAAAAALCACMAVVANIALLLAARTDSPLYYTPQGGRAEISALLH